MAEPREHSLTKYAGTGAGESPLGEIDWLLNLYRSLVDSPDLKEGLSSALAAMGQLDAWDLALAWLPRENENLLELIASWHRDGPGFCDFIQVCRDQAYAAGAGIIGRVWQRGRPEWMSNLAPGSPNISPLEETAIKFGIKTTMAIPVSRDEPVLGVLMFCAFGAKDQDDRVAQLAARGAAQLGFALRHKQIEENLRRQETLLRHAQDELELRIARRTVELTVANEALQAEIFQRKRLQEEMLARVKQQEIALYIGERALAGGDLTLFMQETCERVAHTLEVEYCEVLELQPDGGTFLLRAGVGWRGGAVGRATVLNGAGSQAGYTLASNKPVIVEDLRSENRFRAAPLLLDHGVVSGISVVIAGQERPYGVLGAHATARRKFNAEDVRFLETVAQTVAQAIERKRAELAIQRSESWLRNLVATTQDAVVSIDRGGCVVLFNSAAERIFGYTAAEIVGRKVNLLMAEPYASQHDDYISRYERTGEARAIGRIRTVTGKRKDGTLIPIELSVTEIAVDDQVHYAAFLRDISQTAELHARAVENERLAAIGTTAAKIGHEIANPLNGIYLTLQLVEQRLARRPPPDERVNADILRIKNEIGRLNQLVQEFRALSRQQSYDRRPIRLHELIDELLQVQMPLCEAQGVRIVHRQGGAPVTVAVDEDKFKQALLNLVKNAIEAMPNGGEIVIEAKQTAAQVDIEITDTGPGIAPGVDIFAPFFTTKRDGTGLGLVIVQQIISAHGGSISYESASGSGTKFRVTLPI